MRTTCALCPSGCGLEVRVVDGRAVKVEGSAIHPVNQGVCCLRAQASLEMLYSPERIERPRVRNGSKTDEAAPEAPSEPAVIPAQAEELRSWLRTYAGN